MKNVIFSSAVLLLLISHVSIATAASCESLASMKFPDATVTAAQSAGGICKVALTLKPSGDSDVKVELWLPESNWNGKFEAVGNGGWNGNIATDALATGVRKGYAVASTDTGHEGGAGVWMQHPEKLIDFGYRAVHEMTV